MNKVNDSFVTISMLDKALDKQSKSIVDDIAGIIDIFATRIDERFNKLETRMDRVEASLERMANNVDTLIKRIDDYEKENNARDRQLARLEEWVQQIAKETGVKLKGSF